MLSIISLLLELSRRRSMFEQTLQIYYAAEEHPVVVDSDFELGTSGWSARHEEDTAFSQLVPAVPAHCLHYQHAEALSKAFSSNVSLPLFHVIYSLILLNAKVQCVADHYAQVDDITKILAMNPRYNKNAYPTQDIDRPTEVKIQMYIEGMSSFRAQSMDFQIDIYLQEMWVDKRLAHNNSRRILIKDPRLFAYLIWHPDLYFANARTASFHEVTMPNFLVWIYPNGTVWYDCRVSGAILCAQNLAKYPLDRQMCYLRVLSYAYDNEQIVISWNGDNPIEVNKEIRMPDMRLRQIRHRTRMDRYATGVWSCALAEFYVDREIMHHVIQSYIPTTLIVIISWFSFWLDVEAVPGRVSLSITTLLTLATQSSAARMALPQASYVKAIDVWMGACMAFVFSAMIEFTVVNYCTRRKPRKHREVRGLTQQIQDLVKDYREKKDSDKNSAAVYECSLVNGDSGSTTVLEKRQIREMNQAPYFFQRNILPSTKRKKIEERINRVEENRKMAQLIDRRSRVYFPLAFLIFNIVYWVFYLHFAPDHIDEIE